ncbi:hypothetical protein M404DRAFT_995930 [Pisolithus tinctorius Marx 270]|uniref:Uncharacterized protein n=1 Tax=Pisolithus tinctorius Marx 270 TaxID=870435 RepID=A0A0C3JLD2_PISTI|nr:hypothetical protein M404DRAFT_995930 [Pisolithus tinctorius Marx 270]
MARWRESHRNFLPGVWDIHRVVLDEDGNRIGYSWVCGYTALSRYPYRVPKEIDCCTLLYNGESRGNETACCEKKEARPKAGRELSHERCIERNGTD